MVRIKAFRTIVSQNYKLIGSSGNGIGIVALGKDSRAVFYWMSIDEDEIGGCYLDRFVRQADDPFSHERIGLSLGLAGIAPEADDVTTTKTDVGGEVFVNQNVIRLDSR